MDIVENTLLLCAGYSLAHDGIQVVTKPDKEGTPVGTGVAYVRFSSPNEAEKARKERHRQPMGTRYIECLPFTASHYTSPAALPAHMGPPPQLGGPFAMGMNLRYPGPPAAQRPFPSMTALGQALPGQEVLLALSLSHHLAAVHAQNQACCITRHTSRMQVNVSSDGSAFLCRSWGPQGGAGAGWEGQRSGRSRRRAWGPRRPLFQLQACSQACCGREGASHSRRCIVLEPALLFCMDILCGNTWPYSESPAPMRHQRTWQVLIRASCSKGLHQ